MVFGMERASAPYDESVLRSDLSSASASSLFLSISGFGRRHSESRFVVRYAAAGALERTPIRGYAERGSTQELAPTERAGSLWLPAPFPSTFERRAGRSLRAYGVVSKSSVSKSTRPSKAINR